MKLNYFLILIICVLLLCFNIYIFKRNSTSDRMQDTIIRLVNEDSVKKSSHRILHWKSLILTGIKEPFQRLLMEIS